jgi:hypothetical protein
LAGSPLLNGRMMKITIVEMVKKYPHAKCSDKHAKILFYCNSDVIPRVGDMLGVPDSSDYFKVTKIFFDFQGPRVTQDMLSIYDNHGCTIQVEREIENV